jgi:transposase
MDMRQIRGKELALTKVIKYDEGRHGWIVPSQTSDKAYFVNEEFICNCPDSTSRNITCKHAYAARYYMETEKSVQPVIEMTKTTYKQVWEAYNKAQTNEIRIFDELLKDLVENIEEPPYTFGRPHLSLRETVFCCIQKVYSQLSSRRAHSIFGNAVEHKQINHAPHFNAVSKFLNREDITPLLHEMIGLTAKPLTAVEESFAIDSSGFRTTSFGEYAEQKYHLKRQHKWLKAHICTGVKTNVITGVEITDGDGADSPEFRPLVKVTVQNGFNIKEMTADKAYSSRDNLEAVGEVGGEAFIPFKSNATGRAGGSKLWHKMFLYFQLNQEDFLKHYHKRSNVESTFNMIKAKFSDRLKSKNPVAQKNELLCKIIAHNIVVLIHEMHELSIKPEFSAK